MIRKNSNGKGFGEMSISSFLDSLWLLYTQPVFSEGNTVHVEMWATLDAVKKESKRVTDNY